MKRAIIVHCWEGVPNYAWYPYVKKELEARGFEVQVPEFPDTKLPKLSAWLPFLKEKAGEPDKNLFLIGHSVGCITIMRYLESLKEGEKIGGAILVAGYTDDLGFSELKNFFETPINFKEIKKHCDKFVLIHSDNDPYVDLKYGDELKEKLNAKLIVKHNMAHFSGAIEGEKSCTELSDVVKSVLKISN